ncbi:Fc receptor-like protein 4 [Carassius auratus]|uniref:Fc receptor-like protein 4 n=1 Tax=Carassius auratus TaxID=7957 RepID=A0A6P6KUG5_CARAU|nr:Fc receptor-like protein 4 [Carassius auratus]
MPNDEWQETPNAKVSIKPAQRVFRGDTVTLRCDIDGEGVTSWLYSWYKDDAFYSSSELQEYTFSPVTESDAGKYSCYGAERGGSLTSFMSDGVKLTVSGVTSWLYSWYKDGAFYSSSELQEHTFSPVTESDAGKYSCYGAERGGSRTSFMSDGVKLTVSVRACVCVTCCHCTETPNAKVSIKPAQRVFRGDTVTLRCDIDGEGVTSWLYSWYKDDAFYSSSELQEHTFSPVTESDAGKYSCYGAERRGSRTSFMSDGVKLTVSGVTSWLYSWYKDDAFYSSSELQEHTFSPVTESDAGKYSCYGAERRGSRTSFMSDGVKLTVSETQKAKLSIKPSQRVFRGDTVTLRCDIDGEGVTSWLYSWYKDGAFYSSSELQEHTFSPVTESDAGKYSCYGAERGGSRTSFMSDGVTLTVSGVSPGVSLIISPNRTQHFTSVSLSLSCEDQSNSDRWRVRRYTESGQWEDCSSSVWGSQTGSTCTISSTNTSDTGVYWCQSESGEKYHPVNITVHFGLILESPVHPVTEGDTLTLRCLYQHSTPPNLRADFYKDGSLIQNETTEKIISTVSKSHEGFYYCKHSERGESPKSWISVRLSPSESQISGLHTLSSVLAVSPYLLVTVVLIFKCGRMRGETSD